MGYVNRIFCLFKIIKQDQESDILNLILVDIEESKSIYSKINEMKKFNELPKDYDSKNIISILLASEFKCKILLNYSDLHLKSVYDLSEKENLGPKHFIMLSQILIELNKERIEIGKEALKRALHILINESPLNSSLCLNIYIKLIEISPVRDSTILYFEESIKLLKGIIINDILLTDIKWLISESWSNGIYYYKCVKYIKSEEWMKISLALSNFLSPSDDIREFISKSYPIVLSKITDQKSLSELKKK